ncbi:MAG: hypothetical protein ACOX6N_03820 [Patescibacteria group bacterium]|jgi:hypothetical protein
MDFEKKIEQELMFQVEKSESSVEDSKKHSKIVKHAQKSLRKIIADRLGGRTANC